MKNQDPYKSKENWHVVVTKNSISVECRPYHECDKNSIASFTKREFALSHANTQELK